MLHTKLWYFVRTGWYWQLKTVQNWWEVRLANRRARNQRNSQTDLRDCTPRLWWEWFQWAAIEPNICRGKERPWSNLSNVLIFKVRVVFDLTEAKDSCGRGWIPLGWLLITCNIASDMWRSGAKSTTVGVLWGGVGERWAGLPVGSVVLGSFVEAVGWQTQQKGAAQGGMRAARDRKWNQQQKSGTQEGIGREREWAADKWSTSARVPRLIFVVLL